jgi:hypothetical protein
LTSSSDGGQTWSPITSVTPSPAQQFFGTIATDSSNGIVNIAYYSTQNDPFQQHLQVFLAQVAPGGTAAGKSQLLTSGFADPQSQSPIAVPFDETFGKALGLAAAQDHAYVTFTWNSVLGNDVGASNPDINNHLTRFDN